MTQVMYDITPKCSHIHSHTLQECRDARLHIFPSRMPLTVHAHSRRQQLCVPQAAVWHTRGAGTEPPAPVFLPSSRTS